MQRGTVEFWAKSWNNHWPDSCLHSYIYVKEKYHTWDTCLSVNVLYMFILFGSLHFVLITLLKSRMISFQVMSVSVSSCSTPKDLSQSSNILWLPQIFLNPVSLLFSHSVVSDSLWPYGLQHARLPCPSPSPGICSNSCPLSWWCHPTISSSTIPFSSRLQSFPASESFLTSWLFTVGSPSSGASASASMNIGSPSNEYSGQISFRMDWFDLAVKGTLKSLLQHHSSKASIL